jgi:hypothetical protein
MTKRTLTNDELAAHLAEQLQFIEASADAFDKGFEGEAKRLAVTLRVLLHDTKSSRSLLGQLGRKNIDFLDTAIPFNPNNLETHGGLVFIALGPPKTRYVAMLDDLPMTQHRSFSDWWDAPVFVDKDRRQLSRKNLVLTAVNQDGGAHVDPALDETYDDLAHKNSLNWTSIDGGRARPMDGPERAAIRQIAHEVLKTLKAGYTKMPRHEAGVFTVGMSKVQNGAPSPPGYNPAKVGRNAPCPCGSGKKYKRCHGALVVLAK